MDTVVTVEGNDEFKFEDVVKTGSAASSSLEQLADPVVYQLVRVDGDGRLVPATEDEVMEVEDLLQDVKMGADCAADTSGYSSATAELEDPEGLLQAGNPEVNVNKPNVLIDAALDSRKLPDQFEEVATPLVSNADDNHIDHSASAEQSVQSSSLTVGEGSLTSDIWTTLKPDFSKLEGRICLDHMSVRELHEIFKATFGRETFVKDKQWLKRRISMGLTNSCDVSSTTFFIKDNQVVNIVREESCKSLDGKFAEDKIEQEMNKSEEDAFVSGERSRNSILEHNNEDLHMEQRAAKRVRKPTKRYIEELSEIESKGYSGRFISSMKNSAYGDSSPKTHVRSSNVQSDGRPLVTRQDSFGGCRVRVPYVSRIRRGRPRENFMSLMKLHPSSMDVAARLVKKALGVPDSQPSNERVEKVFKAHLAPRSIQRPVITEPDRDRELLLREKIKLDEDLDAMVSSRNTQDDHLVAVLASKGGMRRKHHRPWSLTEVVKLVEGIARYGIGRWSEIKRFAFASSPYRTSVDLKDKWRNLMRASFVQLPAEKRMQTTKKHGPTPIPTPILVRVRELAALHGQFPQNSRLEQLAGPGRSVHETTSGYL